MFYHLNGTTRKLIVLDYSSTSENPLKNEHLTGTHKIVLMEPNIFLAIKDN